MNDYGNPLKGRQRSKKATEEVWSKEKPVLRAGVVRDLLAYRGDVGEGIIRWTERWLVQMVRERSYPPQIAGCDALAALSQFLLPSDALAVLHSLRHDFRASHQVLFPKEDWAFLLKALAEEGMTPPYHVAGLETPQSSRGRSPPRAC